MRVREMLVKMHFVHIFINEKLTLLDEVKDGMDNI